jgi:hypothetical protein
MEEEMEEGDVSEWSEGSVTNRQKSDDYEEDGASEDDVEGDELTLPRGGRAVPSAVDGENESGSAAARGKDEAEDDAEEDEEEDEDEDDVLRWRIRWRTSPWARRPTSTRPFAAAGSLRTGGDRHGRRRWCRTCRRTL